AAGATARGDPRTGDAGNGGDARTSSRALSNTDGHTPGGVRDAGARSSSAATICGPFPIDDGHLARVVTTLEQRFDRKLQARVAVQPDLIGGIRVVVGDEVLDTSVKARLEQMKVALTA